MFAIIYQGYLKPDRENEYREAWNKVAQYFIEYRGALGSCLHRTSDGLWVAYSRWPDKKTRDNSPGESAPSEELPLEIRNAALTTHIEQFGYFIFDLSKFNPKLVKIEAIG